MLGSNDTAFAPTACGSGDVVVLSRVIENLTPKLWRLNVATGELKQLTSGKSETTSSCTPDGKWVIYQGFLATDSMSHIFKVSIDGGTPIELARGDVTSPAVSPDGSLVVYVTSNGTHPKWVVQSLVGGAPAREFDVPPGGEPWAHNVVGWIPNGRGFTYVGNTTGSTQDVYMQPLTGGPRVQLTHFVSEPALVMAYGWSRDGKKFAVTRGRYNNTDGVMFSNFR